MRIGYLLLATLGLGALPLMGADGCARKGLPETAASSNVGPVVARVAGVPIHAGEVAAQMHRTGGDRTRALEQLVTFELMAKAANAAGLRPADDDPADLEVQRSLKVQRLVEREIEPRIARSAIGDAEVRAVYERAKNRFVHGRLVQVAVLCVFTGARMKPEPRARAEATARQVQAALAGTRAHTAAELEALAKDPSWSEKKVSFTTVWQGDDQPFPAVVGRAVQALSRAGQMTALVGDETGYYLALYLDEKPPVNVSLSEAAPEIRQEMYEPWRRQKFLQLSLTLAQGHDIEVFPENFPLLAEDPGSAASLPSP